MEKEKGGGLVNGELFTCSAIEVFPCQTFCALQPLFSLTSAFHGKSPAALGTRRRAPINPASPEPGGSESHPEQSYRLAHCLHTRKCRPLKISDKRVSLREPRYPRLRFSFIIPGTSLCQTMGGDILILMKDVRILGCVFQLPYSQCEL